MSDYVGAPYVKGSDTSKAAAQAIADGLSEVQAEVFSYFMQPLTCDEVEALSGIPHQTVSARIREMVKMEVLYDTGMKRKTRSNRPAKVWGRTGQAPPPPQPPKAKGGGPVNLLGEKVGFVEGGSATLTVAKKDLKHDLWLRSAKTPAEALTKGTGAWVFDLELVEALREKGIRYVEVPTHQTMRFRTTLDLLLGPLGFSFDGEDGRAQVALELKHWTEL